jgi:hypothetical protein
MDPALASILRAALACLFGVAAVHKARDLGHFAATLAEYRVLPARLVAGMAASLVAVELLVADLLLTPRVPRAGLLGAAGLLLLYAAAIALNLARGRRDIDCGCAGPASRRPIGGWMVARNLVIAAAALAGLGPVGSRALVWVDAPTIAGGTAVFGALYVALDRLAAQAPGLARLRAAHE